MAFGGTDVLLLYDTIVYSIINITAKNEKPIDFTPSQMTDTRKHHSIIYSYRVEFFLIYSL